MVLLQKSYWSYNLMNNMTIYDTYKKIEYYLYNYDFIDAKKNILKSEISDSEYNQNYTKYIKNKSSSLEDLVIKNIDIEKKISKLNEWKNLIENILKEYEQTNITKSICGRLTCI